MDNLTMGTLLSLEELKGDISTYSLFGRDDIAVVLATLILAEDRLLKIRPKPTDETINEFVAGIERARAALVSGVM